MSRALVGALLFSAFQSYCAVPSLDCLYPIAAQRGTTNAISAVGKFDPWPPKMWTSVAGVSFFAETNKGKFRIAVAAESPPGPCFVRAYNEQGASEPRFLVITDLGEIAEREPNNDFDSAQSFEKLPAIVNGRLDKTDDVDAYRVQLNAGQTLVASMEAYVLGSPVDGVIRLLDARGVEVAFNHDDGRTFDPQIIYTAPNAGSFLLQAFGFSYPADSAIRFVGNDKCVYRLHVSAGPCPKLDQLISASLSESEPNNKATNATAVDTPCAIKACIGSPEDEDAFKFMAKKGDKLVLKVESAAFGFPLDARLRIEDEKQKELAKAEDSKTADPVLDWTAPEDGAFVATVRNLLQRGGPDHLYRFSIQRPEPSLKATVSEHAFTIEPGKTNKIKITLKRTHGFEARISVAIEGLPKDVLCEPVEADGKAGEATLSLSASADAQPFSGPIRILAKNLETGSTSAALRELISAGENNGVPNGYSQLLIDATEHLWLTVKAKP